MQPNEVTPDQPTPSTATSKPVGAKSNLQYGQVFFVLHNPGRFFRGQWRASQGILVVQGDKLIFADIKGRTFTVPLNEPTYLVDPKHYLIIKLANGERWGFVGMYGSSIVKPQTNQLAAQYGITRDEIGGVDTYAQSLKRQAPVMEGLAIGAATQAIPMRNDIGHLGMDGIGLAAEIRGAKAAGRNILEGYAKVDQLVAALRTNGMAVLVANPGILTWLAYVQTDRKKRLLFYIMNPGIIFMVALVTLVVTVGQISVIHKHIGFDIIFCTVIALIVAAGSFKLLEHLTKPYQATNRLKDSI